MQSYNFKYFHNFREILFFRQCRHWLYLNLFSISPVMLEINGLWYKKYKDLRPFNLGELVANTQNTLSPEELKECIAKMSAEFKQNHLMDGLVLVQP